MIRHRIRERRKDKMLDFRIDLCTQMGASSSALQDVLNKEIVRCDITGFIFSSRKNDR